MKQELANAESIYPNMDLADLPDEIWKYVNDYNMVSNLGRVKSLDRYVNGKYNNKALKKGKMMSQRLAPNGYLEVGLTINGNTKQYRVSRLVAFAFCENPEDKAYVNHINGVKTDNRAINLEWCTAGENIRHAWNTGLQKKLPKYLDLEKRLNEINPYLAHQPYVVTPKGLGKVIIDDVAYRIHYENGEIQNFIKALRFYRNDLKLVLREMSDLTKEITHKGEKFVPAERLKALISGYGWEDAFIMSDWIKYCPHEIWYSDMYQIMDFFNQYLFDYRGLIDAGLAIENTLENNVYE